MDDTASTLSPNTKGQDREISPRLRAFLNYLNGEVSEDEFVQRLDERVKAIKQDKHLKYQYLLAKFERGELIEQGRLEGVLQEKFKTARRMRAANMSDEQISIATGLSFEEISKL